MKVFTKRDEGFECLFCQKLVAPLSYTTRDHCPLCLFSKHVDINPGDRANPCQGLLEPVGIEKFKNTYKIIYRCQKCGKTHKNIMATDDNIDRIIALSQLAK